ncbi:MAG TPA: endospore germination permease, partial [Clostridia bacterium]
MQNTIISNKQGICMMSMFIIGSAIVVGAGTGAKQDVWISILIGLLVSVPMIFIYAQLLSVYPGKDLYDILLETFGPAAGRVVSMFYLWYSFHLGALVIRNFSEFVNVMSFPETPQFVIIIFLGITSIWIVKAGIEVLGRFSAFVFPIILGIIIIVLTLSTTNMHLINIRPVLYNGIKPILTS